MRTSTIVVEGGNPTQRPVAALADVAEVATCTGWTLGNVDGFFLAGFVVVSWNMGGESDTPFLFENIAHATTKRFELHRRIAGPFADGDERFPLFLFLPCRGNDM